MDPLTATGLGAAVLTTGGVIVKGWNWTSRGRREKVDAQDLAQQLEERRQELEHTYELREYDTKWRKTKGNGETAYAFFGSFAVHQLPDVLRCYEHIGVGDDLGGVLLAELAESEREACLDTIRDELPQFAERIMPVECPNLPGGLHGRTIEQVEAIKHLWYNDLVTTIRAWLLYLDAHTTHESLIIKLSPGGHAALLVTFLEIYRERYPHTPVYLVTVLDHKDVVRERFPKMRALFARDTLVNGTILIDNRRAPQRSDRAIQMLFPAMSAGGLIGTLPNQLGNALSYVFAYERTVRYATVAIWAESLPVKYLRAGGNLPAVYYTKQNLIEEKITRGIQTLYKSRELQSVPLEPAPLGHTRLIYVVAPILPEPDFTTLAKRVDTNLAEWREKTDRNLLIHYASIGTNLSPSAQEVPLIIILLQPLADDGTQIDALALDTHQIEVEAETAQVKRLAVTPKPISTASQLNGSQP